MNTPECLAIVKNIALELLESATRWPEIMQAVEDFRKDRLQAMKQLLASPDDLEP